MAVHKGVGHYGAPITLDQAKKVMAAAEVKAKQNNWNVVISIVDSGGHFVMLERLDGTQLASIRIADGKARTAVEFRRPTKALEDVIASGGAGLRYFTVPGVNLM
jgi:glc operon protein GlcG